MEEKTVVKINGKMKKQINSSTWQAMWRKKAR
jgi:hypothetical protein